MANFHDVYRQGASQNVAYAAAGGASAASSAFSPETYWIQVCAVATYPAVTGDGVRIKVGDGTPVADATRTLLPLNWGEIIAVTPGQKIAALSNNATTGTLSVTELS